MLLEQTHHKLISMKLFGMANRLKERLERVDHQDLRKAELIGLLVDDEWLHRENRKLTARLKVARFKERSACLENLEYSAARSLGKDQVLELAQNRWISAHQGVLITGPSGCGKSFLAQASLSTRVAMALALSICGCRRYWPSSSRLVRKEPMTGC